MVSGRFIHMNLLMSLGKGVLGVVSGPHRAEGATIRVSGRVGNEGVFAPCR